MSKTAADDPSEVAPVGMVWQCCACGKTSRTRYGLYGNAISPGWDESCMLNAVLVEVPK